MNLTFRQLTYFKALAEQRHFGRAAEVVNVSQPALSVQIREMDRQRIDVALKEAVALNKSYELEYCVTLRDGTEKWVSDRGRPVTSHDGETELEGIKR